MARTATKKAPKEEKLEDILFECRNQLRGRAPMTDKRDLLLTLVFLKFVGDRFEAQQEAIIEHYKAKNAPEDYIKIALAKKSEYQKAGVFFLTDDCLWNSLINVEPKNMAVAFDNAIATLEQNEEKLKNALPQQIFTKTALEPKDLKGVVDQINKIDPKKFTDTDLIGRVYEYFLQAFSINADKEEGEFYTPHSIVELIASLIEPYDGTLYDPCCGSGGMFVQSAKIIEAHGGNTKAINVYGQESEPSTFRLAKMNLAVRGISYHLGDRAVSTFTADQHKNEKFDYIMANPPFNLKRWRTADELLDDVRWEGYGVPPESNANYGWILHMLNKLKIDKGVAGFLLANGALDDSDTLSIRQKLIENDKVEAIFVLPRNMFYSTDISVTLWILNNNKKGGIKNGRKLRDRSGEILFVDLRTWNQNVYEKRFVQFSQEQISDICKIYFDWQTLEQNGLFKTKYAKPELYYAADIHEIREKGYSLIPSRYIHFIDKHDSINYNTFFADKTPEIEDIISKQKANLSALQEAFESCSRLKDGFLKPYPMVEIGDFIEPCDERNGDNIYGVEYLRGVTSEREFDKSKAKTDGLEFHNYKIVHTGDFAYNPSRINLGSIAIRKDGDCIISPMYIVFRVKPSKLKDLIPDYLNIWFSRSEFQRSTLFYAAGSVRDTFGFEDMCRVKIPLPSYNIQQAIVRLYEAGNEAKQLANAINSIGETLCPSLVEGMISSE